MVASQPIAWQQGYHGGVNNMMDRGKRMMMENEVQEEEAYNMRRGKRGMMENDVEEEEAYITRCMQEEEGERRRLQIVFFDLETTMPTGQGDKPKLLEFGAVVLAAQGLHELQQYSTLVRQPGILSMGSKFNLSHHCIVDLPSFDDIADQVFDMLHGRIWAGHNIIKFDMVCIRDAFAEARRPSPEPAGVIDTLPLLRDTFGPRAGDLKMASLARYCGLGRQKHRSLADVRMNIEVLKHCATMLFLESKFPSVLMLQKRSPTRNSSRLLEGGGALLPTPKWATRWDQVLQKPKSRMSIEMKRASLIRPMSSSSSIAIRRPPQVAVYARVGPRS